MTRMGWAVLRDNRIVLPPARSSPVNVAVVQAAPRPVRYAQDAPEARRPGSGQKGHRSYAASGIRNRTQYAGDVAIKRKRGGFLKKTRSVSATWRYRCPLRGHPS